MTKKIYCMMMLVLWTTMLAACSDNDDKTPVSHQILAISQTEVECPSKSNVVTVNIIASEQPTATTEANWLNVSISLDNAEYRRYAMTVNVAENTQQTERWAIVKVNLDKEIRHLKVIQLAGVPSLPDEPQEGMTAMKIAADMGLGINIGNTLEAIGGETAWGAAKVNRDYVHGIKQAGFSSVRIPCSWNIYMGDDNVIDAAWLERVHEVVGYCIDEGLYVVLNDHWDNGWIEKSLHDGYNDKIATRLKDMWTQIAQKMEHYDYHLMYAGFNEPDLNDKEQDLYHILTRYGQDFIDAVRATGGNNAERVLVMQAPSTSFEILTSGKFELPVDAVANRMMVECHFYSPYNFVLMEKDESWGNTFWFWGKENHVAGSSHNPTWGEEDYVRDTLKPVYTSVVSKGIPVIMGEYSCMYRKNLTGDELEMHKKSRAAWAKCVTTEAINNGIVPFWWDTPGGLMNRNTGAVDEQYILDGILAGASEAVSPY